MSLIATRKDSYGHCDRQVNKPPGPCSHFLEATRSHLSKFQFRVGRDWRRNTTKPECPDPYHLSESHSLIYSLMSTVSLQMKEIHCNTS